MAPLLIGQKRKAMTAYNNAVKAAAKAGEVAASGDYDGALSQYNVAIEMLRSDLCRQSLDSGLVTDRDWTDQVAQAMFGKVRAIASLDRRNTVFEQADKLMYDVFALKPDWAEAHEFMAELAISRGYAQNASRHINRLLAQNPRHERARFFQAILDFEGRNYDEAIKKLSALAESGELLCYLARCYLRARQVARSIETLEQAQARYGESSDYYYYLGCAYATANRLEEARQALLSAKRLGPERAEPLIQLGNLNLISGLMAEAERCFNDAIKLGPREPHAAYYGLALIAAANDSDHYKAHIENIRRVKPNSDLLRCARGDQHERAGRIEEAAREYTAVAPTSMMAGAVLTRLGFMRYRAKDFRGAFEALSMAAQLRPGDHKMLDLLGSAAAIVGDYRLAVRLWSELAAKHPSDEKIARSLKKARFGMIIELIERGETLEAIEQLESYYKQTGEPQDLANVLADLYFIAAIDMLNRDPADTRRAREFLLLGKYLVTHMKFDYCTAIVDLIEGHNQPAAARLYSVLAANAKNPGVSYHLGLALLRSNDQVAAENTLRHGIAISYNHPSKLGRLKWALASLLVRQGRWGDAAVSLEDFVPNEEADATPSLVEALELKARCLAMAGAWEAAERVIIGELRRNRTAFGDIVLARRSIRADRANAAFLHLEHYLTKIKEDKVLDPQLSEKAKNAFAQLALKSAAEHVRELRFREAELTLRRALMTLSGPDEPGRASQALRQFIAALSVEEVDPLRVNRLAEHYESLPIDLVLEEDDIRPSNVEVPIVIPSRPQIVTDRLECPVFDPDEWDCSPYPDPLVIFDS